MNSKSKQLTNRESSNFTRQISRDTPVQYIKGVGPARARLFAKLGVNTLEDILYYFPWRYEDRKNLKKISDLRYGSVETTLCEVVSADIITTPRKRMKILELTAADKTGTLKSRWFNQAYLKKLFQKGQKIVLSGMVKGNPYSGIGLEMENPEFELLSGDDTLVHTGRIIPVYKATEGLSPKQIRPFMFNTARKYSSVIKDYMPREILESEGLQSLEWSLREAHFPEEFVDTDILNRGVSPSHKRLVFDEFFLLELGLALLKKREIVQQGISFSTPGKLAGRFLQSLPFKLTAAQDRVLTDIRVDMKNIAPMNRLVHGEVGFG